MMDDATGDIGALWALFAETQCRGYSPLYERICAAVADEREVLELVHGAPPAAHMPPVLLAAVHFLLLEGFEHPLADVYAGRSDADPAPLFLDVCRARRDDVVALLARRHTQTNECGRSAVIGPGLTWLASQFDAPLALVDVGTSAGLNLLCDRYRLDYAAHGTTGPTDAAVTIRCRVVGGDPPIAPCLPPLASRVGIDRAPVDLSDPDDTRWLLACVWPDTGRLDRTAASIGLAQEHPPPVVAGDANEVLPGVLGDLPDGAVPVVLTTWALAYLSVEERRRFCDVLATASLTQPIAWLSAEGPGVVDAFAAVTPPAHRTMADVLGSLIFESGRGRAQPLGFVHPHGGWIDWRAPAVG